MLDKKILRVKAGAFFGLTNQQIRRLVRRVDRLLEELWLAGIATLEDADRFLEECLPRDTRARRRSEHTTGHF